MYNSSCVVNSTVQLSHQTSASVYLHWHGHIWIFKPGNMTGDFTKNHISVALVWRPDSALPFSLVFFLSLTLMLACCQRSLCFRHLFLRYLMWASCAHIRQQTNEVLMCQQAWSGRCGNVTAHSLYYALAPGLLFHYILMTFCRVR